MIVSLAGVSAPPSGPQQTESPFFLLGKVVMQQSYVCALIAMMVNIQHDFIHVYIYIRPVLSLNEHTEVLQAFVSL